MMQIKFLGKQYPIAAIQWTDNDIVVTFFDENSKSPPRLKMILVTHKEFRQTVSFLDDAGDK